MRNPRYWSRSDFAVAWPVEGGGIHHAEVETAVMRRSSGARGWSGVRAGRNPQEPARELEPTVQALRHRVVQAQRDAGRCGDGPSTAQREALRRLRRENRCLREARDILATGEEEQANGRPVSRSPDERLGIAREMVPGRSTGS